MSNNSNTKNISLWLTPREITALGFIASEKGIARHRIITTLVRQFIGKELPAPVRREAPKVEERELVAR